MENSLSKHMLKYANEVKKRALAILPTPCQQYNTFICRKQSLYNQAILEKS